MYIHTCVHSYTHTQIYKYVCIYRTNLPAAKPGYIRIYTHMYEQTQSHKHTHAHTCIYINMFAVIGRTYQRQSLAIYVCTYICTYKHTHVHTHMCIYILAYVPAAEAVDDIAQARSLVFVIHTIQGLSVENEVNSLCIHT